MAFHELHRSRAVNGFEPSPISTSDIWAWLQINGIEDVDEKVEFYRLISAMDEAWVNWAKSRPKKKKRKQDGDSQPSD